MKLVATNKVESMDCLTVKIACWVHSVDPISLYRKCSKNRWFDTFNVPSMGDPCEFMYDLCTAKIHSSGRTDLVSQTDALCASYMYVLCWARQKWDLD